MALLDFDPSPKSNHFSMLLVLRDFLSNYLPSEIVNLITTRNEEQPTNKNRDTRIRAWDYSSREEDLYEAVGF